MPSRRIAAVPALAAIAVLGAGGCGDERAPPPRDAAQACLAAMEQAALDVNPASQEAVACPRLYRDHGCAAAWTAAAKARGRVELIDGLRDVRAACRRACVRLSGGVPPKGCLDAEDRPGLSDTADGRVLNDVLDLDRSLHVLAGLSPDDAKQLAGRVSLLALLVPSSAAVDVTAPRPGDPSHVLLHGGRDPVALVPAGLEIHVSATAYRVAGITVNASQLRDALDAHAAAAGSAADRRAVIHTDPDVPYARVYEVIKLARDAGVTDVVFAVSRKDAP